MPVFIPMTTPHRHATHETEAEDLRWLFRNSDALLAAAYFDRQAEDPENGGTGKRFKRYASRIYGEGMLLAETAFGAAAGAAAGVLPAVAIGSPALVLPGIAFGAALTGTSGVIANLLSSGSLPGWRQAATGVLPETRREFMDACLKEPSPARRIASAPNAKLAWADKLVANIHIAGMLRAMGRALPELQGTPAWEQAVKLVRLAAEKPAADFTIFERREALKAVEACDAVLMQRGRPSLVEEGADMQADEVFGTLFLADGWQAAARSVHSADPAAGEAMEAAGLPFVKPDGEGRFDVLAGRTLDEECDLPVEKPKAGREIDLQSLAEASLEARRTEAEAESARLSH